MAFSRITYVSFCIIAKLFILTDLVLWKKKSVLPLKNTCLQCFHSQENGVWKDIADFRLGLSVFSLSIFRISHGTLSVFRLQLGLCSLDYEKCSLEQRNTCLFDFMLKVNQYQSDASFITLIELASNCQVSKQKTGVMQTMDHHYKLDYLILFIINTEEKIFLSRM